MIEFNVNIDGLRRCQRELQGIEQSIKLVQASVESVKSDLGPIGIGDVVPALEEICAALNANRKKINLLSNAANDVANLYQNAEDNILGNATGLQKQINDFCEQWEDINKSLEEKLRLFFSQNYGALKNINQYSSDPVNLCNGNFIYEHTDISIEGDISLKFHRFYNAMDNKLSFLGEGFTHNHEICLNEDGNIVSVCFGDGNYKYFKKNGDGLYTNISGTTDLLYKNNNKFIFRDINDSRWIFNEKGLVVRVEDYKQRGCNYFYDAVDEKNLLSLVVSDNKSKLFFKYEQGMLTQVEDHTGRKVSFVYDNGKLVSVTNLEGNTLNYVYGVNGKITEIKNARSVIAVINTYDANNRVLKQQFPDGGIMEFSYNDAENCVELKERNGIVTKYIHDGKYRNTETVFWDGTSSFVEYNSKNQKISTTDRNGNTLRFSYDNKGNITQIVNALGEKKNFTYNAQNLITSTKCNGVVQTRNKYDTNGNLLEIEYVDGSNKKFLYDKNGKVQLITDTDGTFSQIDYDERGNAVRIIRNANEVTEYEYDDLNRVVSTTDANGNKYNYEYDLSSHISRVLNPEGNERRYEYNESGLLVKFVDYDGLSVQTKYNEIGKVETIIDKEGNITTYEYDKMWNICRIKYANGSEIEKKYNEDNRLSCVTLANGGSIQYEYDAVGNIITEVNPCGEKITYEYDIINRPIKMIDEIGMEKTIEYDEYGNLSKKINEKGISVSYKYDTSGRCIAIEQADGQKRIFEYDKHGRISKIQFSNGDEEVREYLDGRLVRVHRSSGQLKEFKYDKVGNCIYVKTADGNVKTMKYNSMNKLICITDALGNKTNYEYDAVGNLISVIDCLNNKTEYEYTPNGLLASVIEAGGTITAYKYNCMGKLVSVEKNVGHNDKQITQYAWSLDGKLISKTDSMGETEYFSYDLCGRLTERKDREGAVTKYQYDKRNLVNRVEYADGSTVEMEYDALRRLTQIVDNTGSIQIERDEMGRVISATDAFGQTVEYSWNHAGQKSLVKYPNGKQAMYLYDEFGRLASLETNQGMIQYLYDEFGRITEKRLPNKVVSQYKYDIFGNLSNMVHYGVDFNEHNAYKYDAFGNKIYVEKNRTEQSLKLQEKFAYKYDSMHRLTEVEKDGMVYRKYGYDAFGNRSYKEEYQCPETTQTTTYTYNQNNQLISSVTNNNIENYSYDRRGNLTSIMQNDSLIKKFTYNVQNRMQQSFNYEGKMISEKTYSYNTFGGKIFEEINLVNSQTGERKYVNQIRYTLDLTKAYNNLLIMKDLSIDLFEEKSFYWDNNVVAFTQNNNEKYYLQNELGSITDIINTDGKIINRYDYDEFGQVTSADVQVQPFSFSGYQYDKHAGFYFAQARSYDSVNGRFISEDNNKGKLYEPFTQNSYLYCINNPLKYNDFDGNEYVVGWSYGHEDTENFEKIWNMLIDDNCTVDGDTSDWTPEMWEAFDRTNAFSRAAQTKVRELEAQGISSDEIVVRRIDSADDFKDAWSEWSELEDIQQLHIYSHGIAGKPEVYGGTDGEIYDTSIYPKLNWQPDNVTYTPETYFYGCHISENASAMQQYANNQGVETNANRYAASFSKKKDKKKSISTYDSGDDVYLYVYGKYTEDTNWEFLCQCLFNKFYAVRIPFDTFYPETTCGN